ncbi:MAG: hypothetical protein HYX25_02380 [Candidatus Solibacter usitatus]|nr:hypothetical protein [Candidatus Solibacter usitatus]
MLLVGCSSRPLPESAAAAAQPGEVPPRPSLLGPPKAANITVPAGTRIQVRLVESLSTSRNRAGDKFTATLDQPIVQGEKVVVPKGTAFHGHVTSAKDSGRLKGRAVLGLTLDSLDLNGVTYPIDTSASNRTSRSHKKRNMLLIGGGTGLGATLGAVAGGPAGALIGAGAGAAAGTGGAAATGKKHITLPAETPLTFALEEPLTVPS